MPAVFSFLCGYSYAWKADCKPKGFERLEKSLVVEEAEKYDFKNRKLAEQVIDSYGKLGFLLLSRDYIRNINKNDPSDHVLISYHIFNFIYDCKAFLDSIAVMLNDLYSLGRTDGKIDFRRSDFRNAVIQNVDGNLATVMKKLEGWFESVVSWRDRLIHKYSCAITPYMEREGWPTSQELDEFMRSRPKCVMLVEPRPYLSPNFKELNRKHGKAVQEIEPFCQRWIDNSCELFDSACDAISERLEKDQS